MEIYLAQQTIAFLWAVLLGAALGVLYDAFRILRIALPCSKTFIAVQDVLFFLVCACVTFLFLLSQADGKVRFFLLVGELVGGALYFSTISIPIMGISRRIIAIIHAVISFFFRFFFLPLWRFFYWIVSTALRPLRFFVKKIQTGMLKIKFSLLKWHKLLYNQINSTLRAKLARRRTKRRKSDGDNEENR